MRTRSGSLYSSSAAAGYSATAVMGKKRTRASPSAWSGQSAVAGECSGGRRRKRLAGGPDYLDELPDDLVLSILAKVAASATAPSDLLSVHLTCKRLNGLGRHDMVFANASPASLAVKAASWSESAQRFLKRCADAGNLEACYIVGMIRFYCLGHRSGGKALLARAAVGMHAAAHYSLAVIKFNGSGGTKADRDLHAGAALCSRAAALGHVDALRELGHCYQDGYGVRRDPAEGRRLLVLANARELTFALSAASNPAFTIPLGGGACSPLLSDFGWSLPEAEPHAVNQFMVDWWAADRGVCKDPAEEDGESVELRLCSNVRCGRRETRRHEFRRCSVCGAANYCSRACQALDWKRAHRALCVPNERWMIAGDGEAQPQY
ncbi:hypothetical protein PR202_gb03928 [Eleusine coracana subsp. coracana]|uniref:MYND-type domain-containing protein n=1 Tax=Eleusine coracana subsp. coracana TaxID=191504 RepID=A0AAV5E391_ELECO|nr:hypothetical protein QOZ80_1BG0094730 [Eleusine coracana subsp. coracana]GJN16902.1 hypothetical protein PR202_gb03928 [Eleusine coracana subsp. coracana]